MHHHYYYCAHQQMLPERLCMCVCVCSGVCLFFNVTRAFLCSFSFFLFCSAATSDDSNKAESHPQLARNSRERMVYPYHSLAPTYTHTHTTVYTRFMAWWSVVEHKHTNIKKSAHTHRSVRKSTTTTAGKGARN